MRYNFAADSFYIMKLCSTFFVLYRRSRPKDDRSRHFDPHFEEVRGSVEPSLMARWKARVEFLLCVIELLCTVPDVTWRSGRGSTLVVHYRADLQSVHRLCCCDNTTRMQNVSEYMLALCLVHCVLSSHMCT